MRLKWLNALVSLALVAAWLVATPAAAIFAQDGQSPEAICEAATQDIAEPETRDFEQAGQVLEEGVDYWAVLCTAQGPIVVDLLEDEAPVAVNNFVFLARQGYYNNTTFHRVLPGFMAQGGDPTATGSGGPGYEFPDEIGDLIFDKPGILAMANAGPDTNGSQFFITYAPTPWLNRLHTIFGQVYSGQGAAELLTPRDPEQLPDFEGDALRTVVIVEGAEGIAAEPDAAPTFEHWLTLLERLIGDQIGAPFAVVSELSGTRTLDERAAGWGSVGGDALEQYMTGYLAENDYLGGAALALAVEECPAAPEDLPFWSLRFEVDDFGNEESAKAVVADDARSEQLVESGAFESYAEGALIGGRVYRRPVADNACGADAALYRLELPVGRYVLAVEALVDQTVVNDEAQGTPEQFVAYLMDLLAGSLAGPLQRGMLAG
ncbi:MAG: peptidylprolyl isomerase [Chloroflexota bacterium]